VAARAPRALRLVPRADILGGMTIMERITADLTAAMKAQDAPRVSALRMAKSVLKNREIEKRAALDDAEAVKVLQTQVKQREDAAQQFKQGNRPELAAKELAEIEILAAYLPAGVSEADLLSAVERAIASTGAQSAKDIGKVMKAALADLASLGQSVDGKKVNELARTKLS
jgi:uncharacterized protein